jgi:hypothetical protein
LVLLFFMQKAISSSGLLDFGAKLKFDKIHYDGGGSAKKSTSKSLHEIISLRARIVAFITMSNARASQNPYTNIIHIPSHLLF